MSMCTDKNSNCRIWAQTGECNSNPNYMYYDCVESCCSVVSDNIYGVNGESCCQYSCDSDSNCPYMARTGECETNYTYMSSNCPIACCIFVNSTSQQSTTPQSSYGLIHSGFFGKWVSYAWYDADGDPNAERDEKYIEITSLYWEFKREWYGSKDVGKESSYNWNITNEREFTSGERRMKLMRDANPSILKIIYEYDGKYPYPFIYYANEKENTLPPNYTINANDAKLINSNINPSNDNDLILYITISIIALIVYIVSIFVCYKCFKKKKSEIPKSLENIVNNNNSKNVEGANTNVLDDALPSYDEVKNDNYNEQSGKQTQKQVIKYPRVNEFFDNVAGVHSDDKSKYVKLFIQNGFDTIDGIISINNKDLLHIGIHKLGHRKLILVNVQNYKTKQTQSQKVMINEANDYGNKYPQIKDFFDSISSLCQDDKNKYFKLFIENGFCTIDCIKSITNHDLMDIGIDILAHRENILGAIYEQHFM
eukprot:42420_1